MIKLLMLDEQKIFKAGLMANFQKERNIHIPETKKMQQELEALFNFSQDDLLDEISSIQPDVVLVDPLYNNRNRLPFIKKLIKKLPNLKIIILTNNMENIYLSEAIKLGVKAFLLKTNLYSEVLRCVISVASGSNEYQKKMFKDEANETQKDPIQTKSLLLKSLNSTEYDVLKLLSQRKKIIEIAYILNVSERTAYRIKKSMMYKLDMECDSDLFGFFLTE